VSFLSSSGKVGRRDHERRHHIAPQSNIEFLFFKVTFEALLRSGTSLDVCEFSKSGDEAWRNVNGAIRSIDRIVQECQWSFEKC
jgi:hypothetical protein